MRSVGLGLFSIVVSASADTPNLEHAPLIHAASLLVPAATDEGGFHPPSITEFFPEIAFTLFGVLPVHRIHLVQLLATVVVILVLWLGTRRLRLVPGRGQAVVELLFSIPRQTIAYDMIGERDGKRFVPLLTTIFFMVLFFNITGIIPFLNIAGSSIIAVPLLLAVISYATFIYAGLRKSPKGFFKNSLFPSGVPPALYIIVAPLEFLSTFIIRPITLTLRLLMNMMVGHLMLVLFFAATHFFFFSAGGFWPLLGAGTLAFGFAFTAFEILVAFLQAYVFTILTAVYIQLAIADEH